MGINCPWKHDVGLSLCKISSEIFQAIWMLGPALLEFASEEQKKKYIPEIVKGEIRWCQGYSEPGSGSDLASLKTKAEDNGDHFVVNGHLLQNDLHYLRLWF